MPIKNEGKPKKRLYTVTLKRTIEHSAVVDDVAATSATEAIEKAIKIADEHDANQWREGDTIGEDSSAKVQS
jgi:hypothetical protein